MSNDMNAIGNRESDFLLSHCHMGEVRGQNFVLDPVSSREGLEDRCIGS
jgi:hypothetical protein